jgi:hypothetical protein
VQVHHDEGVANRIDPESCADSFMMTGDHAGLVRPSLMTANASSIVATVSRTISCVSNCGSWSSGETQCGAMRS